MKLETKLTIEKLHKCLLDAAYSQNIKSVNKRNIVLFKKDVAKIEIMISNTSHYIVVRTKTEFGGYAIDRHTGPHINTSYHHTRERYRNVTKISHVIEIIDYFFGLPPITKTKSKPIDFRVSIYQNAFARELLNKINNKVAKILNLASGDTDLCSVSLGFLSLQIYVNKFKIHWPTLIGRKSKQILVNPMSPNFDPEKYFNLFIELNNKLSEEQLKLENFCNEIKNDKG